MGTIGRGAGTGAGQGYGSGVGCGLTHRAPGPPRIVPRTPTTIGLVSPEAIRRVVVRNLGQVTHCHEQGLLQAPDLQGRVVIRFIIGGNGAVMASSAVENVESAPSVGNCIASAVRRWQFPVPEGGGIVTVTYPFNLQPPQ